MNTHIIRTLMVKDFRLYLSNRFFAFVTILGVVAYAAIYYLMPATVDENLELGVYMAQIPAQLEAIFQDEEVRLLRAESDAELQSKIAEGEIPAGFSFPENFIESLGSGDRVRSPSNWRTLPSAVLRLARADRSETSGHSNPARASRRCGLSASTAK